MAPLVFEGDPYSINLLFEIVSPGRYPSCRLGWGLFGFWGYELIRWIEPHVPIHRAVEAETDLPD